MKELHSAGRSIDYCPDTYEADTEHLIQEIRQYRRISHARLLASAVFMMRIAHKNQLYGDEPYVNHALRVARLAARDGHCQEVIVACLLHDVVEDTKKKVDEIAADETTIDKPTTREITIEEIREEFDTAVAIGVENTTMSKEEKSAGINKCEKAMRHPISHTVKLYDATVNLEKSRLELQTFTYGNVEEIERRFTENQEAVRILSQQPPSVEEVDAHVIALSAA